MIETFKSIANPLTIIAVFATLSEVSMVFAIRYVPPEQQAIFIWFVVLFPVLLVVLFFLTLNFNHRVLYAPSDFKDDATFLELFRANVSGKLESAEEKLEAAPDRIAAAVDEIKNVSAEERRRLLETVNVAISEIFDNINEANKEVNKATFVTNSPQWEEFRRSLERQASHDRGSARIVADSDAVKNRYR